MLCFSWKATEVEPSGNKKVVTRSSGFVGEKESSLLRWVLRDAMGQAEEAGCKLEKIEEVTAEMVIPQELRPCHLEPRTLPGQPISCGVDTSREDFKGF